MCDNSNESDVPRREQETPVTQRLDDMGVRIGLCREPHETDADFAEKLLGHVDAIIRRLKDLREEIEELETLYLR